MGDDFKDIFSSRLQQARAMKALSLRGLAEELDNAVSHNALAKYECGEMMPSSEVLGRLSDALGQSPDFFFRPFTLRLNNIRFRKRVRLGVKDEESIRQRALEFFERYYEIEQVLGDERRFPGKLKTKPVQSLEDAELAADRLRDEWMLGRDPLANLAEL